MATPAENQFAYSNVENYSRAVTNGISAYRPLTYVMTMGISQAKTVRKQSVDNWRNVRWGDAHGTQYGWNLRKTAGEASIVSRHLRTRDFVERETIANPAVQYYGIEETWGVGEGDLELNQGDTVRVNMVREAQVYARNAVYLKFANTFWNSTETGQNGGLSMFSPTKVAASIPYASIAMDYTYDSTYYPWKPVGYDYGTLTLAANFLEIFMELRRQLMQTDSAFGDGAQRSPDFAVCSGAAWTEIMKYYSTKGSVNLERLQNFDMLQAGHEHIAISGVVLFWDSGFGGTTGYIDGAAAEEILMGYSNAPFIATCRSRKEGFVTASIVPDNATLAGKAGVFKTGQMGVGYDTPMHFGLAYT